MDLNLDLVHSHVFTHTQLHTRLYTRATHRHNNLDPWKDRGVLYLHLSSKKHGPAPGVPYCSGATVDDTVTSTLNALGSFTIKSFQVFDEDGRAVFNEGFKVFKDGLRESLHSSIQLLGTTSSIGSFKTTDSDGHGIIQW